VRDARASAWPRSRFSVSPSGWSRRGAGHGSLNTAWQDWLNLDSQLTAARLVVASALARRESPARTGVRLPRAGGDGSGQHRVSGAPARGRLGRARRHDPRAAAGGAPRPGGVEIGD